MNSNKKLAIILILIFFISTLSTSTAARHNEGDEYEISYETIKLVLNENGLLNVEKISNYDFLGLSKNGYINIPLEKLDNRKEIKNLSIETEGAYNSYKIIKKDRKEIMQVYLYENKDKTKERQKNGPVKIKINYDLTRSIKLYKDIGVLNYSLINDYDHTIHSMNVQIYNAPNTTTYLLNPQENLINMNTNQNITNMDIKTEYTNSIELKALISPDYFINTNYTQQINSNGLEEIQNQYKDYENNYNNWKLVKNIVSAILILSLIIPPTILIKYKYYNNASLEKFKIKENNDNDTKNNNSLNFPTNDHPTLVNAIMNNNGEYNIFHKGHGKTNMQGMPDIKGVKATILDLINRNIIKTNIIKKEPEINKEDPEIQFIIDENKIKNLNEHEKSMLDILNKFKKNGEIKFKPEKKVKSMNKKGILRHEVPTDKRTRYVTYWRIYYLNSKIANKYFKETGIKYIQYYGLISIILGGISFMFLRIVIGMPIFILGAICMYYSIIHTGDLTNYGKGYTKEWKNFKDKIESIRLIKNPPNTIELWNKYIIYGTALHVEDRVYNAINHSINKNQKEIQENENKIKEKSNEITEETNNINSKNKELIKLNQELKNSELYKLYKENGLKTLDFNLEKLNLPYITKMDAYIKKRNS